jgi:PqqD family protein of HPr-rel-A system
MKLRDNIAVSESGFLFDPNSGESFSVNASGKEILRLLAKGKSLAEIESAILSDFDIDEKSFNRYMDDFSHTLRRFNLIEAASDE